MVEKICGNHCWMHHKRRKKPVSRRLPVRDVWVRTDCCWCGLCAASRSPDKQTWTLWVTTASGTGGDDRLAWLATSQSVNQSTTHALTCAQKPHDGQPAYIHRTKISKQKWPGFNPSDDWMPNHNCQHRQLNIEGLSNRLLEPILVRMWDIHNLNTHNIPLFPAVLTCG